MRKEKNYDRVKGFVLRTLYAYGQLAFKIASKRPKWQIAMMIKLTFRKQNVKSKLQNM